MITFKFCTAKIIMLTLTLLLNACAVSQQLQQLKISAPGYAHNIHDQYLFICLFGSIDEIDADIAPDKLKKTIIIPLPPGDLDKIRAVPPRKPYGGVYFSNDLEGRRIDAKWIRAGCDEKVIQTSWKKVPIQVIEYPDRPQFGEDKKLNQALVEQAASAYINQLIPTSENGTLYLSKSGNRYASNVIYVANSRIYGETNRAEYSILWWENQFSLKNLLLSPLHIIVSGVIITVNNIEYRSR